MLMTTWSLLGTILEATSVVRIEVRTCVTISEMTVGTILTLLSAVLPPYAWEHL